MVIKPKLTPCNTLGMPSNCPQVFPVVLRGLAIAFDRPLIRGIGIQRMDARTAPDVLKSLRDCQSIQTILCRRTDRDAAVHARTPSLGERGFFSTGKVGKRQMAMGVYHATG